MVLIGRPVRSRHLAAVEWRVIEYDGSTGLPVGDVGSWWEPAAGRPVGAPSDRVIARAGRLLGRPVVAAGPADQLAGPGSWHLDLAGPPGGSDVDS
jgi:hypothetical protein